MSLRVQFPSNRPSSSFVGTVSYNDDIVNISGKKLSELGGVVEDTEPGRVQGATTCGRLAGPTDSASSNSLSAERGNVNTKFSLDDSRKNSDRAESEENNPKMT